MSRAVGNRFQVPIWHSTQHHEGPRGAQHRPPPGGGDRRSLLVPVHLEGTGLEQEREGAVHQDGRRSQPGAGIRVQLVWWVWVPPGSGWVLSSADGQAAESKIRASGTTVSEQQQKWEQFNERRRL